MTSSEAQITQPIQIPTNLVIERPVQTRLKVWFRRITITTLILVVIADWLFYKQPFGWTLGIFAFLLMPAILLRRLRIIRTQGTAWLILAMTGLCIALMAQPGPLVLIMAILCIVLLASLGPKGLTSEAWRWLSRWKTFLMFVFGRMIHDLRLLSRWKSIHGLPSSSSVPHHFQHWLLPVTLSLGFLSLFAMANPLIDLGLVAFRNNLWAEIQSLDLTFSRILSWCALSAVIWALQRFPKHARKPQSRPVTAPRMVPADFLVSCLGLFNAVFAAETVLDLMFLWGGATLPAKMTYAEYAHRGAYPLIATALLAGLFVLITFRPGAPPVRTFLSARRLVYLWLAQNVFLTVSSMWRLHLYIEAYGLTRWRIAALLWMFLVATGLLWIGCRILTGHANGWLVSMNLVTTLLVLYGCCFVNFDGLIAWHNARHSQRLGVAADFEYLRSLGPESIPALEWLGDPAQAARGAEEARRSSLELQEMLRHQTRNWRGWTWRRHELLKLADHSL